MKASKSDVGVASVKFVSTARQWALSALKGNIIVSWCGIPTSCYWNLADWIKGSWYGYQGTRLTGLPAKICSEKWSYKGSRDDFRGCALGLIKGLISLAPWLLAWSPLPKKSNLTWISERSYGIFKCYRLKKIGAFEIIDSHISSTPRDVMCRSDFLNHILIS